jgi:hypothetical protein
MDGGKKIILVVNKIDLNTCPSGCKLDPMNKTLWDMFQSIKKEDSQKIFKKKIEKKYEDVINTSKDKIHVNFV